MMKLRQKKSCLTCENWVPVFWFPRNVAAEGDCRLFPKPRDRSQPRTEYSYFCGQHKRDGKENVKTKLEIVQDTIKGYYTEHYLQNGKPQDDRIKWEQERAAELAETT